MTDLRRRIQKDEGSLQKLAQYIPGFSGYRELGLRRKADQLVRQHLVGLLDDILKRMKQVVTQWSEAGHLDILDQLDRRVGRLRKVRDNLRYADYGYTGWWDAAKIKVEQLDTMYGYDLKLREQVVEIDGAVQELAQATEENLEEKLALVQEYVERLQHAVDHRGEITASLVP